MRYIFPGMIEAGIHGYHPGFPTVTQFPGYPPDSGQDCPSTWTPTPGVSTMWGNMMSRGMTKHKMAASLSGSNGVTLVKINSLE